MAKKRQKIANRETKYELLRQSEHRDEQNHIENQPTQQLYRENYYEKDADDNYSLNSATQRSIQSSHERSQRKTNMQQRQATYNTGSASTVSRNLVDDVGKRYGYSRPTPKKQTLTSDDIRNDALNELKNRSTPSNATPSTATPSTATRTGNTQTTVSKSLVDYVAKNGNNRTAQATRHHAAMTDFANKGINKVIVDAMKAPINALRNAGGNPLKMADAEAEKMRNIGRNPAAIPEQIRQYSEMTPGQKYMYNHLYDSQGRDAAEEYRSKIMDDINRRVAKQNVEGNIANKVAAGRIANQFVGGVTNSGEGLQKIAQWATLDSKKRAQSVNDYETQMRREKAGNVEGLLQDIASSTGNMAGSVALGNAIGTVGGLSSAAAAQLSSAAFGASQGGHAYQQAINEGHSALRSAAFAGEEAASEYLTEQILGGVKALGGSSWTRYSKLPGTDVVASKVADASTALLNPETEKMAMGQIKKAIIDGMRNKKVKEYLFNALREGSQEGLQYWTTGIARNIILDEGRDEDGNLNPVKGLSFSDPDFWYSAAVGAINSMVMNAGTDLARSAVNNSKAYENYRYEQQFNNKKYVNMNDSMYSEVDPYTGNDGYTEFTEAPVQGEDMQPPTTYGTTFSDTETPGDIFRDNNITVTTEDSGSDTKDATNAAVDKLKKTRRKPAKTADDTKNVADATHDAVNEAVDALKERSEQNTADSTPDAAKEATQAAVEAINTEDAAPVAQETEDSQELIQEPTAEESQNLIEEPAGDSESQSSADIIDQAFNQGGIINQDAINNASPEDLQKIVDIFNGKNEDAEADTAVPDNVEAEPQSMDDASDSRAEIASLNEDVRGYVTDGILSGEVANALSDRANKRFGNDEEARKTYIDFFALASENWPSVDEASIYNWDDFMSKVYESGLAGKPYSRLSNDDNFKQLFKLPYGSEAADAMWKLGYNKFEETKRSSASNVTQEGEANGAVRAERAGRARRGTSELVERGVSGLGLHGEMGESVPDTGAAEETEPVRMGNPGGHEELHTEETGAVGEGRNTVQDGMGDRRSHAEAVPDSDRHGVRRVSGDRSDSGREVSDHGLRSGRGGRGVESSPEEKSAPYEAVTPEEEAEQKSAIASQEKPKGNNFALTNEVAASIPTKESERVSANIDAIKTIKNIMGDGRIATPEEQAMLAKYTGWGGIASKTWDKTESKLSEILTPEEVETAKASLTDAYYTSPSIIGAIYNGISKIGFNGGRLLEPSAGTGRFIGAMPSNMLPSVKNWMAVELDTVSGNIAKLLYPNADVRVNSFEKTTIVNGYMDAVIGNVPFGDNGVVDNHYPKYITSRIHNYFIARSLDTLRPGGIAVLITSSGTLDAPSADKVRRFFMDRADLIGAVRLPNTAFEGTGTNVTSDILMFKKREAGTLYAGEDFDGLSHSRKGVHGPDSAYSYTVNKYFVAHPEMVLGSFDYIRNQYGYKVTVVPDKSAGSLESQIEKAIGRIKARMEYPAVDPHKEAQKVAREARNNKVGTAYKKDGKLYLNKDNEEVEVTGTNKYVQIYSDAMDIRDTAKDLLYAQMEGKPDSDIAALRKKLNEQYDAFIAKNKGGFHSPSVRKVLTMDTDFPFLQSLERVQKVDGKSVPSKSDVFTKNTINAQIKVTHVDTLADGITESINRTGNVIPEIIAKLTDKSIKEVEAELDQSDLAFRDADGNFVNRESYLSGNVRAKLKEAEMLAKGNKTYQKNVDALKGVVPKFIHGNDISISMGVTWIPPEYYARFAEHLMNASEGDIEVTYMNNIGYSISYGKYSPNFRWRAENTSVWGTKDMPFLYSSATNPGLLWTILNNKNISVTFKDLQGKTQHNVNAENALKSLRDKVNKEFNDWVWKDAERTKLLEEIYNDSYNAMAIPHYSDVVSLAGQSAQITLRKHQAVAVNRIVQSPYNTLLQHGVGAGKTFAAIGAAMKLRQLGIASKPCIVVPKRKVADWQRDFLILFPTAKLLVADETTFAKANRKEFVNKIATSDVDAVIISHNQFEMIPMSPDYQEAYNKKQLEEILAVEQSVGGKEKTTRQLESAKKRAEKRVAEANAMKRDTDNVTFEETGIDYIFVDEAQAYKNLSYFTNLSGVSDMGTPDGAKRANDMKMKTDFMRQKQSGKGVTFLTATPIMNSPVEAYTMLRYLMEDQLEKIGIHNLDDFINMFGNIEDITRQNAAGSAWVTKTTFNGFVNMREWHELWGTIVDRVKTEDVPGIKLPKLKTGDRIVVKCQPGQAALDVIHGLGDRLKKKGTKGENHIFKIQSDGKKASFSQRMIDPSLPYGEDEKVPKAVDNIYNIWKESETFTGMDGNTYHNGTQLVFCDYGTPKKAKATATDDDTDFNPNEEIESAGVNVYQDMKDMLVAKGIPAEQIAFIHDFKKNEQDQLLDAVRKGEIRVLFGSSKLMGEGLNVQDRITAIHEMNPLMRPGDVTQAEGRAIRQGNLNPEVGIYVYVTEGTFDTKMWDALRVKGTYLEQIESGTADRTVAYNTSEFGSNAGEIMAIASGNPLLKEQADTNDTVRRLHGEEQQHRQKVFQARRDIEEANRTAVRLNEMLPKYESDSKKVKDLTGDHFTAKVAGATYTSRKEFGEAVIKYANKLIKDGASSRKIGSISGFDLFLVGPAPAFAELRREATYRSSQLDLSSPTGVAAKVANTVKNVFAQIDFTKNKIAEINSNIPQWQSVADSSFEKQEELDKALQRAKEIEEELKKDTDETTESSEPESDDGVLHSMSKHDDTGDKSGGVLNSKKNPTPSEDGEKPEERWTAKKNEDSTETASKRLSDIIGQAAHDWGFNMTSGTRYVKGEGNMGEFNEKNRGIRTKTTNDLPTFSHEFGHWLDKTYNITGSARLPKEVLKDIETAFFMNPDNADLYSGKSRSKKLKEGLAEFVRYYLQNRDTARIDFPKLTDYVLKQMSPGELAKFNGLADQVNAYYSMDAGDAKSSIRLKEDSRPDYRTNMEKFHDWYHGWYQENVDSVHGFREFDVRNGTNTYTYATNAAYTDARVAQTIIEGIYDLDGNYISPGMKYVLSGIDVTNKEVYISFGEYLVLKHGIEWIVQGKRVFADDRKNNAQWMEKRIAEIEAEHPEFIETADRLYKFESDFMWTYAVGEGLISADAYKAMQKENPCYVPFFRAGFKERGNSLFKAKGSGRDLIHPVDNIIDNITKLQNAAARNAVMLQLRREAVRSKADALFMEKMPDPKVPVEVDLRGIKDRLYNETHEIAGIEIAPEMQDALQEVIGSIDDTMTQFQLGKAKPNRGEIKILVAGKPEFWKINDPLLLSSITSMDYRNASKVITAFGAASRFITSNITGNNVIWSVFSNAPRDLQTLLTYSMATKNPGKMLQGVADTYLNYINNARGKSVDPLFSEYLAMGGEGAPVWSGSKDYVKDMRKLLSSTREHPEMNPLKWAMFVSDMIEMGPRFATYKMCREAGMNPQKAFHAAMDITVNFRRNGINSKTLNQFIPFFNAGVQATDKMIRYFTAEDLREMKFVGGAGDGGDGGDGTGKWVEVNGKERGRAIAGRIAFSAALSLIMAALVVAWSRRDKESKDDFDMLSNYTKNAYFCISLGDGKYFTIPKGQNVAVLESFFERLLERTVGDNDHAFDEYYSYLTESTLPSIASNFAEYPVNVLANGGQEATLDLISGTLGSLGAVGEMAQLFANKDYLGRPIVSKQNKDKDYRLQYSEKSSEMAYLLGKYGGWSPQMVDHFGKNILGWMWSYPSAIFPINDGKGVKGKRDWTMGVKNTYLRDNVYSNDLGNWIYDKSGESSKMYKSYGTNEQALESTLDSNMKSYYQKTVGLAKGQEDEREIRRAALDKLKAYRKESDHGVEDADRKAIYDIVESNGNADILPGVMDTSIKSDGKTYDLSGKEYMQYQDAYESYYYDLADDCIKASDSEDKQSRISGELKQLAREQAMDEILSKKGIESGKPSKLKDWTDSGYDAEDYFSLKEKMAVAKVGKESTDDRQKAVKKVLRGSGLSADAQKKLWEIAGYNASTY